MARPRTNAQRAAQAAAAEPTSTASYEAPVAAPVAAPQPSATKFVKKQAEELRPKVYILTRKGGIVFRMASETTTYDSQKNTIRQIRYCPNEPSIFTDEQSPLARREHIIFEDGMLSVPVNRPNLAAYLDAHPDNVSNGGSLFALVQNEKKAEEEIEDEFLLHDAVGLVRSKSIQDLLPVAMYFGISTSQSNMEIRRELLKEAKGNPKRFIESFDNPIVTTKAEIMQAADFQIIRLASDGAYWFDSNRLIISVPAGQQPVDVLARFCLTEKGSLVHNSIKEKLDELS
jgi:hypothetical protein